MRRIGRSEKKRKKAKRIKRPKKTKSPPGNMMTMKTQENLLIQDVCRGPDPETNLRIGKGEKRTKRTKRKNLGRKLLKKTAKNERETIQSKAGSKSRLQQKLAAMNTGWK